MMYSLAKFVTVLFSLVGSSSAFSQYGAIKLDISRNGGMTMMARKPIMAGNWKMNPSSLSESVALAKGVGEVSYNADEVEVVVIPPQTFLVPVMDALQNSAVEVGAQNCYFMAKGAYTGEVSCDMLKSVGCDYVLAGHSERRTLFQDDDGAIGKKVRVILDDGMIPILCCGESKEEYDEGLVESVVTLQLAKDLAGVSDEEMKKIVIAYEPVWAIGTGLTATPEIAQSVHKFIRGFIAKKFNQEVADAVRIQYGGSVTPETVDELMACPDIDGCLVGGASLDAAKFGRIIQFKSSVSA